MSNQQEAAPAAISTLYYLPFWVLLDEDPLPKEPFAECEITKEYLGMRVKDGMAVRATQGCDIVVNKDGRDYHVSGIDRSMLIPADELPEWKKKIADWILTYQTSREKTNVE